MKANKPDRMKNQRGSAMLMVLIALAFGSLFIPTMLNHTYTATVGASIAEEQFEDKYNADAAIEYTLWQLKNNVDGLTDELGSLNPSEESTITINGEEIPVTTEISFTPESDEGAFTIPGTQSGIHLSVALEVRATPWVGPGQKAYFTHVVYVYNSGTANVHLKELFVRLDPELKYLEQSYDGPDAVLTKTQVNDQWELLFDFDQPLPTLKSKDMMVITLVAWTSKDMGDYTFTSEGWVKYAAFQEDAVEVFNGESGAASFGLYDITTTVGSYTILVNVGITETGEIVIRSYQIQ
jgi:hypothetical protein